MQLFAYGTLLVPEIWRRITGRCDVGTSAVVRGYCVRRVRDDLYPVLLKRVSESAAGAIYYDIDETTWRRLDQHESPFYDRLSLEATTEPGATVTCQAYVLPDEHAAVASDDRWDVDSFVASDLEKYLVRFD